MGTAKSEENGVAASLLLLKALSGLSERCGKADGTHSGWHMCGKPTDQPMPTDVIEY